VFCRVTTNRGQGAHAPGNRASHRKARYACVMASSTLISACAVGPDYHPPPLAIPETWGESLPSPSAPGGATPVRSDLSRWWHGFRDQRLNWLVEQATNANPDVHMADARISAARAELQSAGAAFWPDLNASGGYQRMRISPNAIKGLFGAFESNEESGNGASSLFSRLGPIGRPFNMFQTGFDSSWELDLFGGIQRRQEATEAEYAARVEGRRDALVSLTAEVVRAYFTLNALQRRLSIANLRLENRRKLLELAEYSYHEGFAGALDPKRARTEWEVSAATPPALEMQIKHTRHALATLLGLQPSALNQRLGNFASELPEPPVIPAGLPSEVLRRRPDIRRAEREVAAATATLGVAIAELFPKLSLTGSVGFQSQELSNFTSLSSGFYGFGPRLSLPVFQAGRLSANISLQEAKLNEVLNAYQKTCLTAFREVEDALASINGESRRKASVADAEKSAQRTAESAQALYVEGEAELDALLDAQRAWYDTRDERAQTDLAFASSVIGLFKALGGGWQSENEMAGPQIPNPAGTRPDGPSTGQ